MKIYFISGLGADRNVFSNLKISPRHEPVHLNWIPPKPKESLRSYAMRLGERINTEEKFSLVGLSLGGMLATEIAKEIKPQKVILISSIYSSEQFPGIYRAFIRSGILTLLPLNFIQKSKGLYFWFFGAKSKEDKEMLRNCLNRSNPEFTRWAMVAMAKWKNNEKPPNLVQVHGVKDRMLRYSKDHSAYTIQNAGHLTVFQDHEMISDIINKEVGV